MVHATEIHKGVFLLWFDRCACLQVSVWPKVKSRPSAPRVLAHCVWTQTAAAFLIQPPPPQHKFINITKASARALRALPRYGSKEQSLSVSKKESLALRSCADFSQHHVRCRSSLPHLEFGRRHTHEPADARHCAPANHYFQVLRRCPGVCAIATGAVFETLHGLSGPA